MLDGQLIPSKATPSETSGESERYSVESGPESRATSPSSASSASQEDYLAALEANVEQSCMRKVIQPRDTVLWGLAIHKTIITADINITLPVCQTAEE